MDASGPARVRVLVCGERLRRDDGAAILAVGLLPADARELAEIVEVGQLSLEALLDAEDGARFVVVDAAVGVAPGEIVRLPLDRLAGGPAAGASPASSHSLPAQQVLALATELRGAAPRGVFVGLGGADFDLGEEMSAPVSAALPAFAAAIAEAIVSLAPGTDQRT